MKFVKGFSGLFVVFLLLSLVVAGATPSAADASAGLEFANTNSISTAVKPAQPPGAKTPPIVDIIEPSTGTVSGEVPIKATATDDNGIKKVEYSIDGTSWIQMLNTEGNTYQATWDSATVDDGSHTITVRATDSRNAKGQDSVNVVIQNGVIPPPPPPPTADYELFIEIDYLAGHEPTQAVLDYIEDYYLGSNPSGDLIEVTFILEPAVVPTDVNSADGISDSEFWAIEAVSNSGSDNAGGYSSNGVYDSKDKWVLYGTSVQGYPNVVGYCYVVLEGRVNKDDLYGNYIFIADETGDSIENYGAEAVVLMHELGHSIGIGKFRNNREIYDSDTRSVMSYISADNVTLYNAWYYSASYWDTRNLEYYVAS